MTVVFFEKQELTNAQNNCYYGTERGRSYCDGANKDVLLRVYGIKTIVTIK